MVKVWDFWSKYYDNLWVQQLSLRPTHIAVRNILIFMSNFFKAKDQKYLLDIGCGTGKLLLDLKRKVPSPFYYIGADISGSMLSQARGRKLDVVLADAENLPFRERKFFVITSTHAIPYLEDVEAFFKKVKSLLVGGGYFIVACANVDSFWDRIISWGIKMTVLHGRYHSSREIERWGYKAGFSLKLKKKIVGFPFFSITVFVWKKEEEEV